MGYESWANTIRGRVKTEIADALSLTVQYDNDESVTKPRGSSWIRAAVLFGEGPQVTMGTSRRYRVTGLLRLQIFIPSGQGDEAVLEIIDVATTAFRGVKVSGITFRSLVVNPLGLVGDEWQVNIDCPFFVDDIET